MPLGLSVAASAGTAIASPQPCQLSPGEPRSAMRLAAGCDHHWLSAGAVSAFTSALEAGRLRGDGGSRLSGCASGVATRPRGNPSGPGGFGGNET